jgi:predicted transcriptional regulator
VKSLLTTTDLFINRDEPITGFASEGPEVSQFAATLHTDLGKVLPPEGRSGQSVPASPYIRVHLSNTAAHELRTLYLDGSTDECLHLLESQAAVVADALGSENLFGMVLGGETKLGDLLAGWRQDNGADTEPRWFWALAEQIEAALLGKVRPVKWAPYRSTTGRADVPYVASTRKTATGVEFDVYMVPFAPRPVPVRDRMIPVDQMYFKDVSASPLDGVRLIDLVGQMDEHHASRLPVLDHGRPLSIIHKATINDFLVQSLPSGRTAELTVQDLLTSRADAVADSYADVPPDATIEQAMEAMAAKPGCQDVVVTRDGQVVGWLPNVIFIEA